MKLLNPDKIPTLNFGHKIIIQLNNEAIGTQRGRHRVNYALLSCVWETLNRLFFCSVVLEIISPLGFRTTM